MSNPHLSCVCVVGDPIYCILSLTHWSQVSLPLSPPCFVVTTKLVQNDTQSPHTIHPQCPTPSITHMVHLNVQSPQSPIWYTSLSDPLNHPYSLPQCPTPSITHMVHLNVRPLNHSYSPPQCLTPSITHIYTVHLSDDTLNQPECTLPGYLQIPDMRSTSLRRSFAAPTIRNDLTTPHSFSPSISTFSIAHKTHLFPP